MLKKPPAASCILISSTLSRSPHYTPEPPTGWHGCTPQWISLPFLPVKWPPGWGAPTRCHLGRGRTGTRGTSQMTGFKFKFFIDGLKLWSAFRCKQHTRFTFLGENVSFDFLPVYVLVPTTKMLKEPKWITTQKRWSKFQNSINKIAHLLTN